MKRYNAFTIEVEDWSNSEFWMLLSSLTNEDCLFNQPNFNKDGIFWFEEVPKELFKYSNCFNWISGSVKLWHNEEAVNRFNYRVPIYIGEGEEMKLDHYDCINWEKMTDIAPIVKEDKF